MCEMQTKLPLLWKNFFIFLTAPLIFQTRRSTISNFQRDTEEAVIHSHIADTAMSNSNSPGSSHPQKPKGKKLKREKRSDLQDQSEDDSFGEATAENQSQDSSNEVVPYSETEVIKSEETPANVSENGVHLSPPRPAWWTLGIRKDDEFFHFVILCFALGTLLVCYYKYNDWTVSLGIGLMTFAGLETTGIYFGLVFRIRSILEGFFPLLQRIRTPGFRKVQ